MVFLPRAQYRMHPRIAEFPASHFYGGHLMTGVTEATRPPVKHFPWIIHENDGARIPFLVVLLFFPLPSLFFACLIADHAHKVAC